MGIPASGGGCVSNGSWGGGGIRPPSSEHHIPVYCDPNNNGAMPGSVEEARGTGETTVVVI